MLLPAQVVAQGTVMPEMAMAGQGGMPPGFFGDPANSFSSVNPDPFGSVPNLDPFGTGAGPGGRPQAGLGQPAQAPPQPPQVPAPMSGDLWSGPVVPASAVEDLWSSPLTPTPAPSFPSAWSETSSSELWTPQRLEPVENTQALPVVEVSPTEPEPEEFLPIFEAVGSDWFRSSASVAPEQEQGADLDPDPEPVAETRPRPLEPRVRRGPQGLETQNFPKVSDSMPQPQPQPQPIKPVMPAAERQPWSTPSDQGWAAAEAAKKPMEGGVTGSGLPKRVPKANLVPGAASAAPAAQPLSMPPISADRVRSRLSSFQQGVRQGRAEMSERAKAVEGENQQ